MLTTAPPCAPIHARCASCTKPSAATTLTSKTLRTASRSASTSGPNCGFTPALLTRIASPPNAADRGVDGLGPGGGVAGVAGHGEHPGRVAPAGPATSSAAAAASSSALRPVIVTAAPAAEQLGGDRPADPAARRR